MAQTRSSERLTSSQMSKKNRKPGLAAQPTPPPRKTMVSSDPIRVTGPNVTPVSTAPDEEINASVLIRFDRRTKWTLGIIVGLFFLMVLFKLHYVSLPIWNTLIPDGSPTTRGLVAGTPRQIRMDDYAVGAPWILSNINRDFAIENEALGGLKAPLMVAPTKHSITLFKPFHWGFLALDSERGYAWLYDFSPFVLLLGSFLFFMLITGNQYGLSLTGALALLLSSGTVWWSFIPASMIGLCGLTFVTAVYLLREENRWRMVLFAVGLVYLCIVYLLLLYPPYQVPMAYLYMLVLIGYVINERSRLFPLRFWGLKLMLLAGAVAICGALLYPFYTDVQETISAVSKTVYPGQRSESGGNGFIANWFSEYYSWLINDQKFPKSWLNICELSHYLTFAPVIIPLTVALFVIRRRIDWMLAGAAFFTIALALYVEVGWPEWLAVKTLISMSPSRRAQIPLGVGSIILTVLYLKATLNYYKSVPLWVNIGAVVAIIGFMIYTAWINVNDSEGIIKPYQTFLPVVFFAAMNALLLFTIPFRYRLTLFCGGLLLFLLPNLKANPLSRGLTPLTDHLLYKTVRPLVEQDPNARWIVNGSQYITYLVTATGAKQITGVKYLPERKQIMKVLDPTMKRDSAYNRYAHVTFQSYINGTDSVVLVNPYEDGYVIAADPCSPRLKKLNVKYMIFDHQPQPVEVRCMKQIASLGAITIYQANP